MICPLFLLNWLVFDKGYKKVGVVNMNRKLKGKTILLYIWLIVVMCFITPIRVGAETAGRVDNTSKSVRSGLGKVADASKKKSGSNKKSKTSTTKKISDKIGNAFDGVRDSGAVGSTTKNDSIGNTKKKVLSGSDMSLSGANVDKVSGTTKGVSKAKGKVKKPQKPTGKPKKTTGNSTKNTTKTTEKSTQKTVTTTRKKTDVIVNMPKDDASISRLVERINTTVGGNYILVYTPDDGLFSFSGSRYSVLSTKKKIKFMETALEMIAESQLDARTKNKMYHFIEQQDDKITASINFLDQNVNSDFVTAKNVILPFTGPISTALGVLSLVIFIMLTLSSAIDIAWLVIPIIRVVFKEDKNGKPFLITKEAYSSEVDANRSDWYKSALTLYLQRRGKVFIVMGVCLIYLVSGQLYDLIVWIIDSFSWIWMK